MGLAPTNKSMTSLLQCFARLGQHSVALGILDWMQRSDIEPNVFSYTALLSMPAHANEAGMQAVAAHAKRVYTRMQEQGVEPNARFYTALLRVFGRARDAKSASQAWADVQAAGVEPDLILYSTMIDACAKVCVLCSGVAGQAQGAAHLWPGQHDCPSGGQPAPVSSGLPACLVSPC